MREFAAAVLGFFICLILLSYIFLPPENGEFVRDGKTYQIRIIAEQKMVPVEVKP